jgi:hypothetical protein
MKGKKITQSNPIGLRSSVIGSLSLGINNQPNRLNITTELPDDITVDTCLASDTGLWETGINRRKIEGFWVIVSQYESTEEAKQGHNAWVKLMTDNPLAELEDINIFNI